MENYLTFYKDHVNIVKENNSHIIAMCFMCDEEKGHLYISKDTGQFHCKKCNINPAIKYENIFLKYVTIAA